MELPSFGESIRQALRLEEAIYAAVQQTDRGLWVALGVVSLAALSRSLGQSMVLLLNRVRPGRLGFALLLGALRCMAGYLLWSISIWLVGGYLFGPVLPLRTVASAVGLAYAPYLWSFFTLVPFFGPGLITLFSLWSLWAMVVAVRVGFGLAIWQAIVISGLGWLLIEIWQHTLGRPVEALWDWIEQQVAGEPLDVTWQNVPRLRQGTHWIDNWEVWRRRQHRVPARSRVLQPPRGERSHA